MGIRYKKFEPTEYMIKVKRGEVVQKGLGLSFFYNTLTTSMIVVLATAFDAPFAFDGIMTSDFQDVSVQGDISYTISDYEKAARMVDFSYKNTKKENQTALAEARQNQMPENSGTTSGWKKRTGNWWICRRRAQRKSLMPKHMILRFF